MNLSSLFIASFLTNNIVLTHFLGISYENKNKKNMNAIIFISIVLSSIFTYIINNFLENYIFLKIFISIFMVLLVILIIDLLTKKTFPKTYKDLKKALPFIVTNGTILGTTLLIDLKDYNFIEMLVFALGSALGFILISELINSINTKLKSNEIKGAFKGLPLILITLAIMSLIFSRFMSL
jgi:Predicted NADH:ubiquinone oxidoreductase, subunit RnfA